MQDDVVGKAYDARLMRRLIEYLRPHLAAVCVAFVVILGGSLVQLAQPWITQQAIDRYIATVTSLACADGPAVPRAGHQRLRFRVRPDRSSCRPPARNHARHPHAGVHASATARLSFYDGNPVGRMMTRVTTDVDALNDMFASGIDHRVRRRAHARRHHGRDARR